MDIKSKDKKQTARITVTALVTVFLWASAFPAVRYILNYYSAESLMLLRFLVASFTLLVVAFIKKAKVPEKRDIPMFALGGFIGIFLYMWFFNTGTGMVPSGVSSFLISSAPVHSTVLSVLILKEKVRPLCWAGIFISLGGLALIAATQMSDFTMNIGVVLLTGASIFTSCNFIIQRKLSKKYNALELTAYPVFFGTFLMLIFLPALIRDAQGAPPIVNLIPIYLGIFPAAIAYVSWAHTLSKARNIANATMFLYLVPFVATLLAFLWLGETISPFAFLGGIIIILGMFISNKWGR